MYVQYLVEGHGVTRVKASPSVRPQSIGSLHTPSRYTDSGAERGGENRMREKGKRGREVWVRYRK